MISSDIIIKNNLLAVWLIEFDIYKWSSSDYVYNGEFYSGKINGFDKFSETVCRPHENSLPDKSLEFKIFDKDSSISASKGDSLLLKLVINDELFLTWKFTVQTFTNSYGNACFTCIDFLSSKIQNKLFPNTALITPLDTQFSNHSGSEDVCVPVIFGEPYIPLRSLLVGINRAYVLGIDDGSTYSIDRVSYPVEWTASGEYLSSSYTFTQSSSSGLRVFVPYIGSNDTAGFFQQNGTLYDMPTKFSKSSTVSVTNPADIIEQVLLLMGIESSEIDSTTFTNVATTFTTLGLNFNVGYFQKKDCEEILCELLSSCNSIIQIYDKVYLKYIGDSSVKTIDRYDIGKFSFRDSIESNYGDVGLLQYYDNIQAGNPLEVYIPLDAGTYTSTSGVVQTTNIFEKTSGTESWDTDRVYSDFYFSSGCRLRFKISSPSNEEVIVGISSLISESLNYQDIDYSFIIDSGGNIFISEDGTLIDLSLVYSTSDTFEIIYNGSSIIYVVNGVSLRTVTGLSSTLDFYFSSQIKDIGGEFEVLSFDQYIKTDENSDAKSVLLPFCSDSVLNQQISRLYFRRKNWKIGDISFEAMRRLLPVECGDIITISDDIYHSGNYYVTQKDIGFDFSLNFSCEIYQYEIGSLLDYSPSSITPVSDDYDYIVPLSDRWLKDIYIRSLSQPTTPTGESPSGWEETIPTGSDPLWISKGWFRNNGTFISGGSWTTPIRVEGLDGSSGVDARVVNLTIDDQGFNYDINGENPSPASATVTATALNTSGTVYYEFLLNDGSVQNTTSNTYLYTPEALFSNMPDKMEVYIREGSSIGSILARDQITIFGIKEGTSAITVILSNEAHTLYTSNTGVVTYTGSGTTIEVYEGTSRLEIDQTLPYSNSTFRVSASGTNITPGTESGSDGTYVLTYGDHSAMTADNAYIEYDIIAVNSVGTEINITKIQSFAKSIQGDDGIDGVNGSAGIDARAVNLTSDDQVFTYDNNGENPSPASAIVTATSLNTSGAVYYEFLLNDVSVQNTTSNIYSYTSKSLISEMPDKISVQIRENGSTNPVLAVDQITMIGVRDGSDAITISLSNEAHTLPTTNTGVVTYTGSGTTIEVYEGNNQLIIDRNSPYSPGTFRVSHIGQYITPGTESGSNGDTTITFGDHSSMTANLAFVTYSITVVDSFGNEKTFDRIQSLSKSIQGDDGPQGIPGGDGSDGTDARAVNLTVDYQAIVYNPDGENPSPASATVTATALNTSGTVYYEFFLDDVSQQNTTSNTYSYTSQSDNANMPDKIEVYIREGSSSGSILARDQITIYGVVPGADAITISLSNEAHTLPTTNTGVVTYTGSGTTIEVYQGSTKLYIDQNPSYDNGSFRVLSSGTNITPGSESGSDGTYVLTYGDHSAMTADNAYITYTINVVDLYGNDRAFTRIQSFAKSIQGDDGAAQEGPGLVYRGEWNSGISYYKTDIRRDIVQYSGNWYACLVTNTGITPTNASYWESSDEFSFVATDILLAQSAVFLEDVTIGWTDLGGHIADCSIRSGMTNSTTGTGFFLGRESGNPVASFIGGSSSGLLIDSTGSYFTGTVQIGSSGIDNFSDISYVYSASELNSYSYSSNILRTGNIFTKTSGSSWDTEVYSDFSFVGGCKLRFRPGASSGYSYMVGLNQDPLVNTSYASIDYCLYIRSDGQLSIYESGVHAGIFSSSYSSDDVFEIIYNGSSIVYRQMSFSTGLWTTLRTVTFTAGTNNDLEFYLDSSFATNGSSISHVNFESYADVTKTVIENGLITTGSIGDSAGNLLIDFTNATMSIGNPNGLTIESGGGVTVNGGGNIIVEDGGDINFYGTGSSLNFYGQRTSSPTEIRCSGGGSLSIEAGDSVDVLSATNSPYFRSVQFYSNEVFRAYVFGYSSLYLTQSGVDIYGDSVDISSNNGDITIDSSSDISLSSVGQANINTGGKTLFGCQYRSSDPAASEIPSQSAMFYTLTSGSNAVFIAYERAGVKYRAYLNPQLVLT